MSKQEKAWFPAGKCQRELIKTEYIDSQVRTVNSELPGIMKKEIEQEDIMEITEPQEEKKNEVFVVQCPEVSLEDESSSDTLEIAIYMISDNTKLQ